MSDRAPHLRDLLGLKIYNWFEVGKCLGFESEDLYDIQNKCQNDDKECQKRIFARWIRRVNPQDHSQLVQALVNAKEEWALTQLQQSDVPIRTASPKPLPALGFHPLLNMNIILSGPDVDCKEKVKQTLHQYIKDHESDLAAKWSMKMNALKSLLTTNQWNEVRLRDFIQKDIPDFQIWVQVNLGEFVETNELAPLLLPSNFFHFVCIDAAQHHHYSQFPHPPVQLSQSKQNIFHRALHSVSSLWSKATTSSRQFAAAVVTYFGSKNPSKEDAIAFDNSLKSSLESCGCCKGKVIKYCSFHNQQMAFPLTTRSDDYEDHLKSTIASINKHQHIQKTVPTAVHKFLFMCWERGGILSLKDAQELAFICGVRKEEVRFHLHFLHNTSGVILYYNNIPLLNEIIICDPQLLINTFIDFVNVMKHKSKYGQIDNSSLVGCTDFTSSLNFRHIKELLKHYHLLSEIKIDDNSTVIFLPFLLPEIDLNLNLSVDAFPSPFIIKFSTHLIPIGVFYALVCELLQNWRIKNEPQYKNRISFQIDGPITCILSLHAHFIEVAMSGISQSEPPPTSLLQHIIEEVMGNLEVAMVFFPPSKKYEAEIQFYCPSGVQQLHFAKINSIDSTSLDCEICIGKIKTTPGISVWITSKEMTSSRLSCAKIADDRDETMQLIEEHIKHEGRIQLRVAKCLLFGPPNVGKTSTRMRLTGAITNLQESKPQLKSTGIDNPITVSVHHQTESSSVFIATDDTNQWRPQNLQDQADTFINYVLSSDIDSSASASPYSVINSGASILSSPQQQNSTNESMETSSIVITISEGTSSSPSTVTSVEENDAAMETDIGSQMEAVPLQQETIPQWILQEGESLSYIQELIKAGRWKEVQMKLRNIEDTTLLQIIDTGGQPEFHDILPLLLPGPALYLLFINLTQKLNESFPIVYTQEGGKQSEVKYRSDFTYKEMILQLLNTISCMNSTFDQKTYSIATLLGTHADYVTREEIVTLEKDILKCEELKIFLEKGLLKSIPLEGISQSIFPLNNLEGELKEIQQLRFSLAKIFLNSFLPESIPTSWFFFYLALRQKYEVPGCCSVDDATRLAAGFNIASIEPILEFFHNRFGTILYYPAIESLKSLVICNPNIIFKPISHLIASSFGENLPDQHLLQKIRKTGQVPLKMFQHFTSPCSIITAAMIVDLLKHHNIITEARGPDNTPVYFMPCLLKPDNLSLITAADIKELDPAPLVINFKGAGYVPVGFFPSLVVKLSYKWILDDRSWQYRNHINFIADTKTCTEVSLLQYAEKFEVRVRYYSSEDARKVCMDALNEVHEAIEVIKDSTPYFKSSKPEYGFYCTASLQKGRPHFAVCFDLNSPQRMFCSQDEPCPGTDKCSELLQKHKIWFEGHKNQEVEDMEVDAQPKNYRKAVETLLKEKKVSSEFLGGQAWNEIYCKLSPHVSNDWHALGAHLGIDYNSLQTIKSDGTQQDDRLGAVIHYWLMSGRATRLALVKSLASEKLRFYEIAYDIATSTEKDY